MNTIIIALSKSGKHAGKHEALIDPVDKDLAEMNWMVRIDTYTCYAGRSIKLKKSRSSRTELMHRVILARMLGRALESTEDVDHVNGNGLDNRRANLRIATQQQNSTNAGMSKNNTSGYKNVTQRSNGKYRARITIDGKRVHIGDYATAKEAHEAYCLMASKHHGEWANFG